MRLNYITRVKIPSTAAQAVQIAAMSSAFNKYLGNGFSLVSPKPEVCIDDVPYHWEQISCSNKSLLKYIKMYHETVKKVRADNSTLIYTRDIALAHAAIFTGGKAVYEAHKEIRNVTAGMILNTIASNPAFSLVAISKALMDHYLGRYKIQPNKVLCAHSGVALENYEANRCIDKKVLRKQLGLPITAKIVMHTGSLYKNRGAELFEPILQNFPEIQVIQVGGNADDIKYWMSYYRKYRNINFIGHQPQQLIPKYQMAADLLLYIISQKHPNVWCSSPLKVFEYMASGVPILTCGIGSVTEILDNSNTYMFNPDQPVTIIECINKFLNNPGISKEIAEKCLKDVKAKYTWEKRAQLILEFSGIQ